MENLRHIAVITPQLEMYGIMLEDACTPCEISRKVTHRSFYG